LFTSLWVRRFGLILIFQLFWVELFLHLFGELRLTVSATIGPLG
jgi:hypothetical protein